MAAGNVEVNLTSPNAKPGALFDGVDDYISASYTVSGDSFTLSAWVKRDEWSQKQVILIDGKIWFNFESDNRLRIYAPDLTDTTMYSNVLSTTNDWINIVAVYKKSSGYMHFYMNGEDVGQDDTTGTQSNSGNLYIGSDDGSGFYFNGTISEVRIWNRALSASEVELLYKGEVNRTNLIGEWLLQDNYNDTAGSNDGTNHGSRLGIFDGPIAKAVKADRTTANDKYLIAPVSNGRQIITCVIEEAP